MTVQKSRAQAGGRREIRRLAIVNRGEAAMRCIRAVKALRALEGSKLEVLALYTDPDHNAPFVRHADLVAELSCQGGAVAAYLDHDRIVAALRANDVDAVWPGWGFVAEDDSFVERLASEGIIFLGPSADAMRALGDKITSKELAEKAGIPVTAWSGGALVDEADAMAQAKRIGYPVVLKATAGGGGRGIRIVHDESQIVAAFRSASSEAQAAFGDGALFCEKLVRGGRHIEVQIAADCHGHVVALGCRDCSVQRRHQKVLEEAPPPGLSEALREALEGAACRMASYVSYVGVGTVEFLLAGEEFFFLEVNPRLQVEHGITEELTGVDLVQLQIRIARDESIAGVAIHEHGCAIEARVCAEDPAQGFLPAPGYIARFDPALGPHVRIDTGVAVGTTVSPDFDSLIAKVIGTGDTREEARARLVCALRDFDLVVEGGASNKGYLIELLENEEYRAGSVDTSWLDRLNERTGGAGQLDLGEARDSLVAAAILAYQRSRAEARTIFYADTAALSRERIPASEGQEIDLTHEGESYRLMVYAIGAWRYRVHLDDRVVGASMREEGAHLARLIIDDRIRRIVYDCSELGLRLEVDGHPYRYGLQVAGQVRSVSPAMVVAINVSVGDTVVQGQPLGLLEAMKMEIGFQAPVAGIVTEVRVRPGQQVAAGEVVLVIDPGSQEQAVEASGSRISLPEQHDPLSVLFRETADGPLGEADLAAANRADLAARRRAMDSVREEVRRALLGFDANRARGASLVDFLETPLPEGLSESFLREMAEIRHELTTFVDIEQLFIRAPRASVSGGLGPSNDARFRMYVRRHRAAGAGVAEEFLDLVRGALAHYGVVSLEPTDALERAMLRLLSAQLEPKLRYDLVLGMLRRIAALAEAGIDLEEDRKLARALAMIARMRPQVSDAVADAALEASYVIYLQPGIERRADRTSKSVEKWLSASETDLTVPPTGVLLEVAAAPRRVFDRVGNWISGDDPARCEIALAAHTQRRYAPRAPLGYRTASVEDTRVHCVEYPVVGVVLTAVARKAEDIPLVTGRICRAARLLAERDPQTPIHAVETVVPVGVEVDFDAIREELEKTLSSQGVGARFTLGMLGEEGGTDHVFKTWVPVSGGMVLRSDFYDLHPETAEHVELARYSNFVLERVPAEEGIYTFYGHARDTPADERIFVLADLRDRGPAAGRELEIHLPAFERTFNRAARSLRSLLQVRDPRRRLQWNRIAIFVAPPIYVDAEEMEGIARRLAPATRHLGIEKVLVRLNLLDREKPEQAPVAREVEIIDSRDQMEIRVRVPHHAPLQPAADYERRVVTARSNRQMYPYETVKMLTVGERNLVDSGRDRGNALLPTGSFEEYDLDAASGELISVAGRPFGENVAGVVVGLITTPTEKVPEGMRRVLALSDPTLGMGALSAPECDRLVAALDLAESLQVPLEWVAVSSGAKIAMDSGTENLDATARVVRRIVNFTQNGGTINVIVAGVNIGAQAYFDALATMLMHTRGVLIMTQTASMVLTGRRALEAAGSVSAEDELAIGGFERIMGPNGEAQYFTRSLADAYRILYEAYRYSYIVPGERTPRRFGSEDPVARSICDHKIEGDEQFGFKTVGEIFDDATNPGRKRPFGMRSVMKAVIDQDGGELERWSSMVGGETAIVWDAHLGGIPIELIGIESHTVARDGYRPYDGPEAWNGGTLFPYSSKKVARAINAASGNRPVVILANLSGFDGSPESLRKLQLEYGAEIARAVVNFEGPILFNVVSRYHGGAYVVFSQALNPRLKATALTGSFASVIGGGPAASVVFAREVRARAVADARVKEKERSLRWWPSPQGRQELDELVREVTLEKQAEVAAEFDRIHSVERARDVGSLSGIIEPHRLRHELIEALEAELGPSSPPPTAVEGG